MLNSKQFMERYNISKDKLKKMIPYLQGVEQCPCCKQYMFNDDVKPIYIPHKTRLKNNPKKYYIYVLEALNNNMELIPEASLIDNDQIATCIRELKAAEWIAIKVGRPAGSLDYHDYMPSPICPDLNSKTEVLLKALEVALRGIAQGVTAGLAQG
jgi:hypothetical protein